MRVSPTSNAVLQDLPCQQILHARKMDNMTPIQALHEMLKVYLGLPKAV